MLRRLALLAMLFSVLTLSVSAEDIFAVTTDGKLIRFDSEAPGTMLSSVTITGLQTGETIVGMDFRPATGQLYALGSTIRLYIINPSTGVATQVGGTAPITLPTGATLSSTAKFGFDFNPQADRIRVVTDAAQNFRINPNDGTIVNSAFDPTLAYFDQNSSSTPKVSGAAYNNNSAGAAGTALFEIDPTLDLLVRQDITTSALTAVGKLGVDFGDVVGLDISAYTGVAYATAQVANTGDFNLFEINLSNGAAFLIGSFPAGQTILDIAIPTGPTTIVFALGSSTTPSTTNALARFNAAAPGTLIGATTAITGLTASETVVGMDFRPANGQLYMITSNGNNGTPADGTDDGFQLYTVDTTTAAATKVGSLFAIQGAALNANYGMDFNPTVDRIRFVSDNDLNVRINPDTGVVAFVDTALVYAAAPDVNAGANPACVASAYTNNFVGGGTTTLYNIDVTSNFLVTQNPPNNGVLNSVGTGLGVTAQNSDVGFDISPDGRAFANIRTGGAQRFYAVSLTSGKVSEVGTGIFTTGGFACRDIAIPTAPTSGSGGIGGGRIAFTASSYQVVEGQVAQITLTRTNGSTGLASVFLSTVTTNGNTATSGTDFIPIAQTVTFADGETSRTVLVEGLTDSTLELFETAGLVISNPVGCSLGTLSTSTLIVVDVDDRDGDGFTTAEELAAGTSDNNASDTPFGGAPAGTATALTVDKTSVKLNFTKAAGDSISFSGSISGLGTLDIKTLKDKKVVLNYGGVIKSLTLTDKGKAVSADKASSFSIGKPKDGVSKYSVKFNKGDFDGAPSGTPMLVLRDSTGTSRLLNDSEAPSKASRTVNIRVLFNGNSYVKDQALEYTVKKGKGASAVAPKNR